MILFAYGSLRPGYWNARHFLEDEGLVSIGPATTADNFQLYVQNGNVPCAVFGGSTPLIGDLWDIPAPLVEVIHRLESGYKRSTIIVKNAKGEEIVASIYYVNHPEDSPYSGDQDILVKSGDFKDAVSPRGELLIKR